MSSPRSEADVRKAIRARINDLFPGCYVESNPPSDWGESGRPDMEFCLPDVNEGEMRGVYTGLELKSPDFSAYPWRGLTEEQQTKLLMIAKANGLALLTNNAPKRVTSGWSLAAWAYVLEDKQYKWEPVLITGRTKTTYIESYPKDKP